MAISLHQLSVGAFKRGLGSLNVILDKATAYVEARKIDALDYLQRFITPNYYFHLTMAYGILRHNGLDVGKRDFLGMR